MDRGAFASGEFAVTYFESISLNRRILRWGVTVGDVLVGCGASKSKLEIESRDARH